MPQAQREREIRGTLGTLQCAEHYSVHPLRDARPGPKDGRDGADESVTSQKGRQKVQLAASCCSAGLRFRVHSSFCPRGLSVECAKSIPGAAGRLLGEHRTKGWWWCRGGGGRGLLASVHEHFYRGGGRPVHLAADAPTACDI